MRDRTASSSARACSSVAPGLSRPTTLNRLRGGAGAPAAATIDAVAVDRRRRELRLQPAPGTETRNAGRQHAGDQRPGVRAPRRCCRRCAGRPGTGARSTRATGRGHRARPVAAGGPARDAPPAMSQKSSRHPRRAGPARPSPASPPPAPSFDTPASLLERRGRLLPPARKIGARRRPPCPTPDRRRRSTPRRDARRPDTTAAAAARR